MADWPFDRANASGYSTGDRLPASHATLIDEHQAQAADGLLWTDTAILKNWLPAVSLTDAKVIVAGQDTGSTPNFRVWKVVGTSDMESRSVSGYAWSTPGTHAALVATTKCGLVNGQTVLFGGDPGGASTSKIARSTTGLNAGTFAAVTSIDATAAAVNTLAYFNSLYVAGLSDGGIETSADGATWADRTVPNSNARTGFAQSSARLLAFTSASTDKYIYSTNATSWTEGTLPASSTNWTGAWNEIHGLFVVTNAAGSVYTSPDGLAPWTLAGTFSLLATATLAISYRRVVAFACSSIIVASIDAGTTWFVAASFGTVSILSMHYDSDQIGVVLSDATARLSFKVS